MRPQLWLRTPQKPWHCSHTHGCGTQLKNLVVRDCCWVLIMNNKRWIIWHRLCWFSEWFNWDRFKECLQWLNPKTTHPPYVGIKDKDIHSRPVLGSLCDSIHFYYPFLWIHDIDVSVGLHQVWGPIEFYSSIVFLWKKHIPRVSYVFYSEEFPIARTYIVFVSVAWLGTRKSLWLS